MLRLLSWAFLVATAMIWATTVVRGDSLADVIRFPSESPEVQAPIQLPSE